MFLTTGREGEESLRQAEAASKGISLSLGTTLFCTFPLRLRLRTPTPVFPRHYQWTPGCGPLGTTVFPSIIQLLEHSFWIDFPPKTHSSPLHFKMHPHLFFFKKKKVTFLLWPPSPVSSPLTRWKGPTILPQLLFLNCSLSHHLLPIFSISNPPGGGDFPASRPRGLAEWGRRPSPDCPAPSTKSTPSPSISMSPVFSPSEHCVSTLSSLELPRGIQNLQQVSFLFDLLPT